MNASTSHPALEDLRVTNWADADLPIDWRRYLGARGLLFVLIHGTWCPSCLEQLVWLRRRQPWLTEQGIGVLALSVDDPIQVEAFHKSLWSPLPFALISDADARMSRALGFYEEATHSSRWAVLLVDCAGRVHFGQIDQHVMPEQALLSQMIEQMSPC